MPGLELKGFLFPRDARVKSRNLKGLLVTIAGMLALVAVVYVVWQRPNTDELNTPPETVQRPTVSPQPGSRAVEASPETDAPVAATEPASSSGDTNAPQDSAVVEAEHIPHDMSFEQVKSELWEDIQANPPVLLERGDPLIDADLAYRIYTFYGNCTTTPRSSQTVDQQLGKFADYADRMAERDNDAHLEAIESRVDRMMNVYELCLAIPPDLDARLEAVQWMTEAVHLGHEIAQVQYYEKAMGFMVRPDYFGEQPPLVMKHPGLIEAFKSTAQYALSQGMEKGHPEAYLAMARVMMEGLIYPKDPVMAYAYARTAEMKASQSQFILDQVGRQKQHIAQYLTQEQVSEAEQLALDLWKESND